MKSIIPFIAALLLALITYLSTRKMSFAPKKSAASRIESYADKERLDLADRIGKMVADRLGLNLETWKHELRWAQIGGFFPGWTVGKVLGQSVLFGGIALVYAFLFGLSPVVIAGVLLAAYYPYMRLRSRAGIAREATSRMLPEAAALIAAEMNAGGSIDKGLERAANLPGPMGVILKDVMDLVSAQGGALLFSHAGAEGVIVRYFVELKYTPLESFAARIDAVASKGADGPRRMNDLAGDLSTEYQVFVARAAETLDGKLLMPTVLFFFGPLLLAVFIPMIYSIFQVF
jgi:hypothetical protein